jgi:DNA-binding transcriptional LysR family regulator
VAAGLAHRIVHREQYVMIRARAARRGTDKDNWNDSAFVTYDESEYLITRWYQRCLDQPPPRYRSLAHMEEMEEVVQWVGAGHGIAVVPASCLSPAIEKTIEIRQTRQKCPNDVYAVWNASGEPHAEAKALIRRFRPASTQK